MHFLVTFVKSNKDSCPVFLISWFMKHSLDNVLGLSTFLISAGVISPGVSFHILVNIIHLFGKTNF